MLVLRIGVCQRLATMLAVDEIFNHPGLQRAGSEQSHERNYVLETIRAQIFNQFFHAATFELEHRCGVAALKHSKHLGVIKRQAINIQRRVPPSIDHLDRPLNNRQRTQAEKIELHEARFFNIVFVVLGDNAATVFVTVNG